MKSKIKSASTCAEQVRGKNQKILLTLLVVFPLLFSCEYETLPTYSGVDQIYFNYAEAEFPSAIVDSIVVKFGYDDVIKSDSVIRIAVKVMGSIVDYPRTVDFIVVDSTSTAQFGRDVTIIGGTVPAGRNLGTILLKLHNTEALDGKSLVASLRLVENEYFKTDYTHVKRTDRDYRRIVTTQIRVRFDNAFEMPNLWAHPTHGAKITTAFGKYSRKKFEFMCQVLPGCSRAYFTYKEGENPQTVFDSRFPIGVISAWARALHIELERYYDENGERLLDENGEIIESGSAYT